MWETAELVPTQQAYHDRDGTSCESDRGPCRGLAGSDDTQVARHNKFVFVFVLGSLEG